VAGRFPDWITGHIIRLLLCAMQQTQYPHSIASNAIGGKVGRTGDGQLARSFNAAWAAHLWKTREIFNSLFYTIIRGDCSP
jgi:hypothetical protein